MRATVPLYSSIASRILDEYGESAPPDGHQLPSEAELSARYGVSRSTVREALSHLRSRNRVRKLHGIGTFLLPASDRILDGIETLSSYVTTIARGGRTPGDVIVRVEWAPVPDDLAHPGFQHSSESGRRLLQQRAILVESLRTADGSKIIYCHDYLLPPFTSGTSPEEVGRLRREGHSLLAVMERSLGADLEYSQLYARAVTARGDVAGALDVPVGSPILELRGVTYANGTQPAYFSRNWFLTDEYEFQIVRRKATTDVDPDGTGL